MAKYEARYLDGNRYLVVKRRLFGLLPPLVRIAIWDGCWPGVRQQPDWYWAASGGGSSKKMAHFRARWALVKEFNRVKNLSPAEWSPAMPPARMLEGK